MSLPTVRGMVMDTEEETSKSPIAIPRGLFSGLASDTIERNDDAVVVVSPPADGRKRDSSDLFGVDGGFAGVET